ncbi:aspartate/glutamate racemase family protein [bacterium]|nr:aspartate/glutamate racemase family protein [bacterium]
MMVFKEVARNNQPHGADHVQFLSWIQSGKFPSSTVGLIECDGALFGQPGRINVPYVTTDVASDGLEFCRAVVQSTIDERHAARDQDHINFVMDILPRSVTGPELGVIGGMGPEASIMFLDMVICRRSDMGIRLINIPTIPDRTRALLTEPHLRGTVATMIRSASNSLIAVGVNHIVVPCNTAHAFTDGIDRLSSLIENTRHYVAAHGITKFTLLATNGTRRAGIYMGDEVTYPDDEVQAMTMALIFDHIKKGGITDHARSLFEEILDALHRKDQPLTVGLCCTELPLIARDPQMQAIIARKDYGSRVRFIDPMEITADLVTVALSTRRSS